METKAEYDVKSSVVYLRACTLKRVEDGWEAPNKEEFFSVFSKTKLGALELARRLGVSRKLLNKWMRGVEPIPFTAWVVLCQMTNQGFSRMSLNENQVNMGVVTIIAKNKNSLGDGNEDN